jgi:hypothetical protein
MENLNYDLVSDCCGAGCAFETGEGKDKIGICMDCKEWCGVVEDVPEDEADYIPGLDDGEGWDPIMGDAEDHIETDDQWLDDYCGEEDFG